MIDLLIAVDLEAKYRRWLAFSSAARRLDAVEPTATCEVFTQLYRAFPTELLFEYEVHTTFHRSAA